MSILYPVAANAETALGGPRGRAARERDAERLAGEPVSFVREFTGPVFKTQDAALDAYAGRLDDGRPGRNRAVAPEDRFCELKPVAARGLPFTGRHSVWRLSVAYWRIGQPRRGPEREQARKARKRAGAVELDKRELEVLTDQPLLPLQPQKALDIGLFEVRLPENPEIVVADE